MSGYVRDDVRQRHIYRPDQYEHSNRAFPPTRFPQRDQAAFTPSFWQHLPPWSNAPSNRPPSAATPTTFHHVYNEQNSESDGISNVRPLEFEIFSTPSGNVPNIRDDALETRNSNAVAPPIHAKPSTQWNGNIGLPRVDPWHSRAVSSITSEGQFPANNSSHVPQDSFLTSESCRIVPQTGSSRINGPGKQPFDNIVGIIDPCFEQIIHPRGFYRRGRLFMTLWAEPQGFQESDLLPDGRFQVRAFAEMARFIVIRTKRTHCLCLRISTYSGQATTKPGIAAADHVPVVPVGEYPVNHPSGEQPMEGFVSVKVEANDVTISPMSRINFAKIYTIEHNIRVRNIGRVDKSSMGRLEGLFSQSLSIVK